MNGYTIVAGPPWVPERPQEVVEHELMIHDVLGEPLVPERGTVVRRSFVELRFPLRDLPVIYVVEVKIAADHGHSVHRWRRRRWGLRVERGRLGLGGFVFHDLVMGVEARENRSENTV